MRVLWHEARPLSTAEIWQRLSKDRSVARTTVITMVQRLEKRGWIRSEGEGRSALYAAACEQPEASHRLASSFVSQFFDGSPSRMLASLLGAERLSADELARLRALLDQAGEENVNP